MPTDADTLARVQDARATADELAAYLAQLCDDPNATRYQLDNLASVCYHAGEYRGIPGPAGVAVQSLRALGNRLWSVVTELDRLREEAEDAARQLEASARAVESDAATLAAV